MPKYQPRRLCVPESILASTGGIETVILDERYAPYTRQGARIENLCGRYTEYVSGAGLDRVVKRNGTQKEFFHLHGNILINQGVGWFMGVRGADGMERLSKALSLSSPSNLVHMAVLTSKLGKRVQVSANGLLETNLEKHTEHLRVGGRMYEHTNAVRFTVHKFEAPQFRMPEGMNPDNNDWMVTGKGMLIIRLSWRKVDSEQDPSPPRGIRWCREVEEACLDLCNRVTEWIGRCC
jgi:hypothetical protein